ncbi:Histone deacetylase 6 [Acipenser ruthenus]|uniref:Histone deacetylase 6 n=1 Tax=Acipenser ruthenus TaxID=7906 RepID=A0A444UFE6_ACIRT|nr:Histone deacetylase 6 [Acipenser ruthenus]
MEKVEQYGLLSRCARVEPGMNDADYISAFQQLLLPVAYEFRPQLVLVAAGFDSVVGDPKGGYNLRSTAEGVCACLKMLLGDPCPRLESPFSPCQSALDSISKTVAAHRKHWKCLQVLEQGQETGSCDLNPGPAVESDAVLDRSMREVMRGLPPARTGLVYDERMKEHHNMWDRVLILDWDVHHGNGTQHIFEDDPSVLYVSLHRYDNGLFFPSSSDAGSDRAGRGRGLGYNVNIPWNASKMGNPEYIAAFQRVVMPIAYQFDPELVLVSAGFDAARGDPLGGCHVTPECYGHMTHMLQGLAGGRVLIVLEGGYNLSSISESMSVCTSVLLGDSPPDLGQLTPPHPSAVQSLHSVLRTHRSHWSALRLAVPESVSSSLPTPSQKGQRTKAKKSPRQEVTPQKRSPGEDTHPLTPEGATTPDNSPSVSPAAVATVADDSVDQITAGLQSVALGNSPENQTNQSPASVAVGGARRKVKPASPEGGGKGQRKRSGGGESSKGTPSTPGKTEVVELKESAGKMESTEGTMFAVEPLPWCPHLETVNPLPAAGLDVFGPCRDCGSGAENWVCLVCYQVHCGRYVNQHMMEHRQSSAHMLVLSFSDLSVWCYGCEAYVHHQVLHDAKNAAHRIKFGENMPGLH